MPRHPLHPTRPGRRATTLLVTALLALLSACGGGGGDEPPPPAATRVAAGQRTQAALGAAGGTLQLATAEGARFTLAVPAGAVPEGTLLALETAAPAAGRRLHLRLSPAGLVPAAPLELTLELPASMALPAGATLVYDRAPVPFTRLADGRLRLQLPALAGAAATAAEAGRAQALAARALAAVPTPACQGVPVLETTPDGGLADSAPIVADDYGSCMLGAVNALALSGEFAEAVRLASALGAYLQSIGAANSDGLATRFLTEARALACTAYGRALDDAAGTTVNSFASLTRAVKPVLFWEAAVQQLGTTCPGIPPTRYVNVVENLTSDALRFYASKQGAVVDVGSVEYTEAVAELRAAPQVQAQLRSLQAPAPVQALARAQVQQRAQPAIVDAVLQAPWQRCRDSGQFDRLIELMEQAGSPAAVKSAAQYCGTLLQAQARNAGGAVTATLSPALGGVAAGNERRSASLAVAKDGTLVLSGPIRALQCPAGRAGGSESLEIRLGSTVLQTLGTAPYLGSNLSIDIAQALRSAGIEANSFTGGTLSLHRTGSPCGGFWGDHPEPLLTLELTSGLCVPPAGRDHCITVLADLNSTDRDFHGALAISDRGGHVYVTGIEGGTRAAIWQRGRASPLPDDFYGWGGAFNAAVAVANDGSVAGTRVTLRADGSSLDTVMPAVFNPATGRLTDLLDSPIALLERMPQPEWPSYAIRRNLQSMTLSPEGRVTFTLFESPEIGWAASDLGFCASVRLNFGTGYDCHRYRRYEATASGGGRANLAQTLHPPETGDLHHVLFDGGSGIGRYGLAEEFIAQQSVLGGIGGYRTSGEVYRARELGTVSPRSHGGHRAADRAGRTLTDTATGLRLVPAHPAVPEGWFLGALGTEGHLEVCSSEAAQARVIDLDTGRSVMTITGGTRLTHQGLQIEAYAGCAASARRIDALGRLLGYGRIESPSREVPLVFTPAGVALP